jgi:hypothetical protein
VAKASTTFQPGHPKVGGRKLKSKNKITRDVAGLLDKLGVNPIEGMAMIAADPTADLPIRARMHAELAKYVHPQLRQTSLEVTGKDGAPLIPLEAFDAVLRDTDDSTTP